MTNSLEIVFAPLSADLEATSLLLAGEDMALGGRGKELDQRSGGAVAKAAEAAQFKGKRKSTVELLAPPRIGVSRLVLLGTGKGAELKENDWTLLGGSAVGAISARKTKSASIIAEAVDTGSTRPEAVAALLGIWRAAAPLRVPQVSDEAEAGRRDRRARHAAEARHPLRRIPTRRVRPSPGTRRSPMASSSRAISSTSRPTCWDRSSSRIACASWRRSAWRSRSSTPTEIEKLKMGALLAVAQGSVRPARVAIMQWHGAKSKRAKPLAFIGKGVVFDTGGISIKPAAGMEDMKGDMGGAACVVGLMHALAERKANVNAVGIIGLVENMPSGSATRPGDIVTAHSGQTVEILNTDAEGRLVLADLISYAQERFKPRLIIDLATLTGAIMVALGKEYAGLFVNDDKLAHDLLEAVTATGEKVWRMPLDKAYDKMIESKNADIKNIGGRWAGACTAAAFLKYFVKDTPWAHIDLAGTAMDAPKSEINPSWGSGWGVRLLDRFVSDKHERAEK